MSTWTDCPGQNAEEQIMFAQREILRRLDPARVTVASRGVLPRREWQS
jgi:hypothetical protein